MKNVMRYLLAGILLGMCMQPLTVQSLPDSGFLEKNDQIPFPNTNCEWSSLEDSNYSTEDAAIVKGFVKNIYNNSVLNNTYVGLWVEDNQGNYYWNETVTDVFGYFEMNIHPGIMDIYYYKEGYFEEDYYNIIVQENQILWSNMSLFPIPPVTAYLQGMITDGETGLPISDAHIDIDWRDPFNHWWDNDTYTNDSGYFFMGTLPGEVRIYVFADGYFYNHTNYFNIYENETIWVNLSLNPEPPQTVLIQGFITDLLTNEPIDEVDVLVYWRDNNGNNENNWTETNEYGYFTAYVAPGEIRINCYHAMFEAYTTDWMPVYDNETVWLNISMQFEPTTDGIICGYVKDKVSQSVVSNAYIRCDWKDSVGHQYSNQLITDRKGYFELDIAYGEVQLYISKLGYSHYYSSWFSLDENLSKIWINYLLKKQLNWLIMKLMK